MFSMTVGPGEALMMQTYTYKLAPIELSTMRILQNSKHGVKPSEVTRSIKYTTQDKSIPWAKNILERFVERGLAFKIDGIYYKK